MKFSVITATFNAGHTLGKCLDSVRDCALAGTEQIVMDNLSIDNTAAVVSSYSHVKYVREADGGIYDAMNKGIALAQGEIVSFLNADDYYLAGTLEKVQKVFEENPDCSVVHGNIVVNGKVFRPAQGIASFGGARIYHPAAFFRKELFEKYGHYDCSSYRICADLDFFMRIRKGGEEFVYLDEGLTCFALDGVSTRRRHQTACEVRNILLRHGFGWSFAWGYYSAMELRALASRILKRRKESA